MMEELGVGLAFMAIYYIVIFGISITMYLLEAFGLYKMGKNMGLSNPWLSFIPVANVYAFGRIAEKYVMFDGKPSAKFSKILLTLYIIMFVVLMAVCTFIVVFIIFGVLSSGDAFIDSDSAAVFGVVLPLLFAFLAVIGVSIAFSVLYYIALWRLFAIYDNENATLYLVLSLFFGILAPIFIFILRNKQPKIFMPQPIQQVAPPQQEENIM